MASPVNTIGESGNLKEPGFWLTHETEFKSGFLTRDHVADMADVHLEFMSREKENVKTVLGDEVSEQISLVLDGLGVVISSRPYALLPKGGSNFGSSHPLGLIRPVFPTSSNGKEEHNRRRITLRIPEGRPEQIQVFDVLSDVTTNENWKMPNDNRTPERLDTTLANRTVMSRPVVERDAQESVHLISSRGYEDLFQHVEQVGEEISTGEVLDMMIPFIGGTAVDVTCKIRTAWY